MADIETGEKKVSSYCRPLGSMLMDCGLDEQVNVSVNGHPVYFQHESRGRPGKLSLYLRLKTIFQTTLLRVLYSKPPKLQDQHPPMPQQIHLVRSEKKQAVMKMKVDYQRERAPGGPTIWTLDARVQRSAQSSSPTAEVTTRPLSRT